MFVVLGEDAVGAVTLELSNQFIGAGRIGEPLDIVAEIMNQEFVVALRGKGLTGWGVFLHVVKNAAPNVLAVLGLQLGYLMGGSILVETVFSWPGTGLLLNSAIFQRDLPVLQGTILVLSLFFVALNLLVDLVQTALDPRIKRA
jgi:peptide/nickel transport system permease protein